MSEATVPIEKYREITSQSALKDAEITQLKQALADAEFLLKRIKTEKDSIDAAEREEAINIVVNSSSGKIKKDDLKDVATETINRMAEVALKVMSPSAVQVMRQREADQNKAPTLDAMGTGTFNQETGKWEGGYQA